MKARFASGTLEVVSEAIAEALDRGDGKKAGALLASHANHLVRYLQKEIAKQKKHGKRVVIR